VNYSRLLFALIYQIVVGDRGLVLRFINHNCSLYVFGLWPYIFTSSFF